MIINPRIRGFICTTAHPVGLAAVVERQAALAAAHPIADPPKVALIVGSSMGYGLASRITAAFGGGAATLGVCLEKPGTEGRTGTAGWYNTAAFHRLARARGLWAETLDADAFADDTRAAAIEKLRRGPGAVDLLVYSVASPRRTVPGSDEVVKSSLKPVGAPYRNTTVDVNSGVISEVQLEPATEAEVADTVTVMGGDDWRRWVEALESAGLLAPNATTLAYSYIGPKLTWPIYRHGTIGRAKDHLEATAHELDRRLGAGGGRAFIAVNKAVVTQSSSAIPVVPLYISLLFRVMKDRGLHEGCIEQMVRLFAGKLRADLIELDENGRIRMDDWEMQPDIQEEVERRWNLVPEQGLEALGDLVGYRHDFLELFGFGVPGVDYAADVDPVVSW